MGFEGFRRQGSKALGLEFWALEVVGVLGSWGGQGGCMLGLEDGWMLLASANA